jgi:hypothetical protein
VTDALATISDNRSDLAGLDEIEEQTRASVNHRAPDWRGRNNWALPPSIERARASREPQKPQQYRKFGPVSLGNTVARSAVICC